MSTTYGTNVIPSDQITVRSGATVSISAAFDASLGLVGGMDTNNGSSSPGTIERVASVAEAENLFGAGSELATQVRLAQTQNQPPTTIYAVGVPETTGNTESFAGTDNGTLSNTPIFDPNIHSEHDVSAQDTQQATTVDVNIVYDSTPSQPSDSNTINLNPITGAWVADASSDYDITYDYGNYDTAISDMVDQAPRFVCLLTESQTLASTLETDLENADDSFSFMHGVVGATPRVSANNITDFKNIVDSRRISVVAPPRGVPTGSNSEVRMMGAVAGKQAGKTLGDSTTYEPLEGFSSLVTQYTDSELGTIIDNGALPLKQGDRIRVIKDMTTDSDPRFERIYASEIIDEVVEISHQISQGFIGGRNTDKQRNLLRESHRSSYDEMLDNNLLDAYTIQVSEGANPDEVDVEIGVNVVDVMDIIDVTITVGDVITGGAA